MPFRDHPRTASVCVRAPRARHSPPGRSMAGAAALTCGLLVGLTLPVATASAQTQELTLFDFLQFTTLPEPLGAQGSRANAAITVTSPRPLTIVVGESFSTHGAWLGAVWEQPTDASVPWRVDEVGVLGMPGCRLVAVVQSLINPRIAAGGSVVDAEDTTFPVVWERIRVGDWDSILLPLDLTLNQGEVTDLAFQPNGLLAVCGRGLSLDGTWQPLVWRELGQNDFLLEILPPLVSGGEGQALGILAGEVDNWVVGWSESAEGAQQAVVWRGGGAGGLPWSIAAVAPFEPGSDSSQFVAIEKVDSGDLNVVLGGISRDGVSQAANWILDRRSGTIQPNGDLPLLPGNVQNAGLSITPLPDGNRLFTGWSLEDGGQSGDEGATAWSIDVNGVWDLADIQAFLNPATAWRTQIATDAVVTNVAGFDLISIVGIAQPTVANGMPQAFVAREPRLRLAPPAPGLAGTSNTFRVERAVNGEKIYFIRGIREGTAAVPGCPALRLDSADPVLFGSAIATADGSAELRLNIPGFASGRRVLFQALAPSACEPSNLVDFTFP